MTTEKIQWVNDKSQPEEGCLVCGNLKENYILIRAKHWHNDLGLVSFAKCSNCHSYWTIDSKNNILPYPSSKEVLENTDFKYLVYHYIEIVNGLDWKTHLIEKLKGYDFKSILEVGCNVGITLDFCGEYWKTKDIQGLEPSAYGMLGRELLSINIENDYLENFHEIRNKKFDFIFSTEVVEHVENPRKFICNLKKKLSNDGVLLLTTPRPQAIQKNTAVGELYAALSPGAHYFLLSKEKLISFSKKAGFKFFHIENFGITHVIYLSNNPISINRSYDNKKSMMEYYRNKMLKSNNNSRIDLSNMINYYLNEDNIDELLPLEEKIDEKLLEHFNFSLENKSEIISNLKKSNSIFDLGKILLYSTPFYLYKKYNIRKESGNEEILSLTILIILHGLRIDFQNMFVYHKLFIEIEELKLDFKDNLMKKEIYSVKKHVPELANKGSIFKKLNKKLKGFIRNEKVKNIISYSTSLKF